MGVAIQQQHGTTEILNKVSQFLNDGCVVGEFVGRCRNSSGIPHISLNANDHGPSVFFFRFIKRSFQPTEISAGALGDFLNRNFSLIAGNA